MIKLLSVAGLLFCGLLFTACTSTTDMHFKTSVLDHENCAICNRGASVSGVGYAPQSNAVVMNGPPPMQQMQMQPPMTNSLPPYPVQGMPPGPPSGPAMREHKVFVGGGNVDVGSFSTEMLIVITESGTRRVKAVVDGEKLPIVAKPNQAPPSPVAGLTPDECLVPLAISTEPPGYPPIFTPVWIAAPRR